jgi:ABC-type lipoprotein export system ATPase subunit
MDIFDELNDEGVTIVMITHEREVADRAKRICYIRDGVLTGGVPELEHWGSKENTEKTLVSVTEPNRGVAEEGKAGEENV